MPEGPDYYDSMSALYANETEGINFTKEWYRHRARYKSLKGYVDANKIFIIAPHGGSIESGTTELALATAGFVKNFNGATDTSNTYDYFIFNGTNPSGENGKLHVTSSHYNDVDANVIVKNSVISLAFHGCTDLQPDESTGKGYKACLIGGLDEELKEILEVQLMTAGFNAYITTQDMLDGSLPNNIVNKNKRKQGIQVELTTSLRKSFFTKNNRKGRRNSTTTDFWVFVNVIRACLEDYGIQFV
ncbi:poly-gamma-glutamate hydrolase family protein [Chryseolinea sp. H1M3-3]|uniref:poly-gamma-glutamate hydrolase family protein n=1 Tax=Chryseolinea sp. H1M3-3 TaxID=3034144 RepID=UPI0023EAA9AC|nr:poly-gamma-glutamate hydrolase family protein [Chryseolinea sp. H1M3-3]